ncbi:MAG: hypothetical protein JRJ84_08305, partial [Deltaproteobacteria bacterium]|nr:hypothetical protein [Deltaproteobacteria bacterium]
AVDTAVDEVEAMLGGAPIEGWQVHTHIQPLLQRAAERAVAAGMLELDRDYPLAAGAEVALVAVRVEDGAVVAMVGGRDYRNSPFNRATRAWRHPGSTVKPLTLLAAFDRDPGLSPTSTVVDEPISRVQEGSARPWSPRNYDGAFLGEITLREAIEHSRNIPAVKLAEEVGLQDLQTFYRDSGLSRATAWRSAALGAFEATPMEVAGAYTIFPGGGTRSRPWLVRSATKGRNDAIRYWEPERAEVASARASALATSVLQGVITDGTGARAQRYGVRGAVGGKTGTTDDFRDAWFVGFTPDLAVAVWVGRDRDEALGLSGSRAALPTWSRFVVASGTSSGTFPRPEGLVTVEMCTESHQIARDACPTTYPELFAEGHVSRERCDRHGGFPIEIGRLFDLFGHRKRADVRGDAP